MTPIRKGLNPVKLPFPIRSTDPTLAAWCSEVRTAIQQLESRIPTANIGRPSSGSYVYPWKITTSIVGEELRLKVAYGAVTSMRLVPNIQPIMVSLESLFNSSTPTYLTGDPYNPTGTEGYSVLSTSTIYGVWVKVGRFPTESQEGFGGDDYDGLSSEPLVGLVSILVTSSFPDFDDQPTYDEDYAFIHVGTVTVDGSLGATIVQRLRSDIFLPIVTYPYGINFPVIVSADDPNSIGVGSDGGALYVEP
jgi:hypothetical protein